MRDPQRIEQIISLLKEIWMNNPDWRFGQLISNVVGQIMRDNKIRDMFFPEDDIWKKGMESYLKSHSQFNYGQDLLKGDEIKE